MVSDLKSYLTNPLHILVLETLQSIGPRKHIEKLDFSYISRYLGEVYTVDVVTDIMIEYVERFDEYFSVYKDVFSDRDMIVKVTVRHEILELITVGFLDYKKDNFIGIWSCIPRWLKLFLVVFLCLVIHQPFILLFVYIYGGHIISDICLDYVVDFRIKKNINKS